MRESISLMRTACLLGFPAGACVMAARVRGGWLDEEALEVVGDEMKVDFLADHFRCQAAQDIEAKDGLDFAEVKFDGPSLEVEFGNGLGGVLHRVEQGGDKRDLVGAKAFD